MYIIVIDFTTGERHLVCPFCGHTVPFVKTEEELAATGWDVERNKCPECVAREEEARRRRDGK